MPDSPFEGLFLVTPYACEIIQVSVETPAHYFSGEPHYFGGDLLLSVGRLKKI